MATIHKMKEYQDRHKYSPKNQFEWKQTVPAQNKNQEPRMGDCRSRDWSNYDYKYESPRTMIIVHMHIEAAIVVITSTIRVTLL